MTETSSQFQHANMSRVYPHRRGVLLLIILSILVLFVLLCMTFITVASHYRRAAVATARGEPTTDDPERDLSMALYQLVRGTSAPNSSLLGHSLLGDLYGNDGVFGTVSAVHSSSSGQFVVVEFPPDDTKFSRFTSYYSGGILTMLEGPARGYSTRIVDYTRGRLVVEPFDDGVTARTLPGPGDHFLINGRPFNGTGTGYNSQTQDLDATSNRGLPIALLPHYSRSSRFNGSLAPFDVGGTDESWDAVDYQNMFLAAPAPINIPSFHRPALIEFWRANSPQEWNDSEIRRQVIMRPLAEDHPLFTGSNPAFDAVDGPWDVDNDNDGFPDSVWLDLGFPIRTTQDGRPYKPLFAILCLDLDGRININAHGNLDQLDEPNRLPIVGTLVGPTDLQSLPRGQGHGPSEINPSRLFSSTDEFRALLKGRNGLDQRPGTAAGDDPLSFLKNIGRPYNDDDASVASAHGSPIDARGRGIVVLDFTGHPIFHNMGASGGPIDDPYATNLLREQSSDRIYSLTELERLLRRNDADAGSLPSRLLRLAPRTFNSWSQTEINDPAKLVTTRGMDVPVPHSLAFRGSRGAGPPVAHIADLLVSRLRGARVAEEKIDAELLKFIPFELLKGQRMDVNRPFGNGRDDNGNGIVDEPSEAAAGELVWTGNSVPSGFEGVSFSHTNDDPVINQPELTRQIYARHLFCLMLLLTGPQYLHPIDADLSPVQMGELTVRRIAQWAINAVDFRDNDAIMTPFEYDVNPFNGWHVDGHLTTNEGAERRVVWGCEYPDLIITETVALHDRRVRDTPHDDGSQETRRKRGTTKVEEGDPDLDQYRIPQGSLFVELYCPRNHAANGAVLPRELYAQTGELDLGRMAPPTRDNVQYPVWRIAIAKLPEESAILRFSHQQAIASFEPDNMSLLPGGAAPIPLERIVWLAAHSPAGNPDESRIFTNRAVAPGAPVLLPPARYAVVGPRNVTHIGTTSTGAPSAQSIVIDVNGVTVTDNGHQRVTPTVGASIQPMIGIVAAARPPATWTSPERSAPAGIGISVSEPLPQLGYYREPTVSLAAELPVDAYDNPQAPKGTFPDKPFDSQDGYPLATDGLTQTGTRLGFRAAFLQRLANPLQAYDPTWNPYITVDWAAIDLTVFNGEDRTPDDFPIELEPFDSDDPKPFTSAPSERFATRQRGRLINEANLWSPWTNDPGRSPAVDDPTNEFFPHNLANTLGYLNSTFVPSGQLMRQAPPAYVGAAPRPFPWLAWNNRPYVSHLELMLVPSSSPARLLHELTPQAKTTNPYDYAGPSPNDSLALGTFQGPFGHLLNFFHSSGSSSTPEQAGHFYRVFDYLEVPSAFIDTESWRPPHASDSERPMFIRPPNNKRSVFRVPGKVNINTVVDPAVWRAVAAGFPPMDSDAFWERIVKSREGYGGRSAKYFPTRIANPFRSSANADLMPLPHLKQLGAQAGLLRSDPVDGRRPLFVVDSTDHPQVIQPHRDQSRNAYFYYQGLQRLGNLLTTHSNVYAIWITLGYFRVKPHDIDEAHPDGFQLTQEVGSETGEVRRHRAFYIIDRSIPVAFEQGRNHNVDDSIILRRVIE